MSYGKDSDLTCRFWVQGQSFRIKYPFQSHFLSLLQPCSWPPRLLEDGEMGPARARQGSAEGSAEEGCSRQKALGSDNNHCCRGFQFQHLLCTWHRAEHCASKPQTLPMTNTRNSGPILQKKTLHGQSHLHKVIQLIHVFVRSFIPQVRARHPQRMRHCSSL